MNNKGNIIKRKSYEAGFKLKVVDYAEEYGNRSAERHFGVSEKVVRGWRKQRNQLEKMPKSKRAARYSSSPYQELEKELCDWVVDLRNNGLIVTRLAMRAKALQLAPKFNFPHFKSSAGWCSRFMNRCGLTLRQKTHIAKKLPKDIDEKIHNFAKFIIKERKMFDFSLENIINMDETPMYFDMPGNTTVDKVGTKTVTVKTTGHEKQHFTVVLACRADGKKLLPMVIFKRKNMPKETFVPGVVVKVHPKGWMDETLTRVWLDEVYMKRPGALLKPKSLLVWDMFRAHCCDSVKEKLKEYRTRQAVIPGGCTSILQPLDVSINKPFKTYVRKLWNTWMISGEKEFTKSGAMKRPGLALVVEWVKEAWDSIPEDIIVKSFKKCAISNAMDGTEDDMLYKDFIASSTEGHGEDIQVDEDEDEQSDSDDELNDYYEIGKDDMITDEQIGKLFDSDNESLEFEGFNSDEV